MKLNNSQLYVSTKEIQRKYDVSSATLRRWNSLGEISSIRTPGNHRLYNFDEIENIFKIKSEKRKICYARVSSVHQKEDLERQIDDLHRKYPNHEIIRDIGSGLNWHRKGFERVMKDVMDGKAEEIVLARTNSLDYQEELAEDLLAVVNVFVAKNNGRDQVKIEREEDKKRNKLKRGKRREMNK